MAPPHGLQLSNFLSIRNVSTPCCANASAALAPAGPPPTTATRSLRPSGKESPAQTTTLASAKDLVFFSPVTLAPAKRLRFCLVERPAARAVAARALAASPMVPAPRGGAVAAGGATGAGPVTTCGDGAVGATRGAIKLDMVGSVNQKCRELGSLVLETARSSFLINCKGNANTVTCVCWYASFMKVLCYNSFYIIDLMFMS